MVRNTKLTTNNSREIYRMTTYVTIIDTEGDIQAIWTTGAVPSPAEGPYEEDSTKIVVHITGSIEDLAGYRNTHYYKDGSFVVRETSPGSYYNWINEAWVSDSVRLMKEIRRERDMVLYTCDWTQLSDTPLTNEKKVEWATYRQQLRDVPIDNSSATDLGQVAWPTPPT